MKLFLSTSSASLISQELVFGNKGWRHLVVFACCIPENRGTFFLPSSFSKIINLLHCGNYHVYSMCTSNQTELELFLILFALSCQRKKSLLSSICWSIKMSVVLLASRSLGFNLILHFWEYLSFRCLSKVHLSGSCPHCVVCLVFVSCFYVCFVFEHMALSLLLSAMCSSCPASLLLVAMPPCLVLVCLSVVTCPSCLWSCSSECCHLFLMFSCPFILFSLSLLFCQFVVLRQCLLISVWVCPKQIIGLLFLSSLSK